MNIDEIWDRVEEVAAYSPCEKRKVGAVIIAKDQEIAVGYNYNTDGTCCEEPNESTKTTVVHAEVAAIHNMETAGIAGTDIYVNYEPCPTCRQICLENGLAIHVNDTVDRYPNKLNEYEQLVDEHQTDNVDEILKERGKKYGSYELNLSSRAQILSILDEIHEEKNGELLSEINRQALNDIVIKLVRLAATPKHKDSWTDIAGYAKLNQELITE